MIKNCKYQFIGYRYIRKCVFWHLEKNFFILWPVDKSPLPQLLGQDFVVNFATYKRVYTVLHDMLYLFARVQTSGEQWQLVTLCGWSTANWNCSARARNSSHWIILSRRLQYVEPISSGGLLECRILQNKAYLPEHLLIFIHQWLFPQHYTVQHFCHCFYIVAWALLLQTFQHYKV